MTSIAERIKKFSKGTLHPPPCGGALKTWEAVRGGCDNGLAFLRSRSGATGRLVRYPMPLSAPWRRNSLDIGRRGALGDVLMCTPALRELKRKNPTSHIRFYTDYAPLVRGLPYIDEVLAFDRLPNGTIILRYEDVTPPRAHIAKILGDNLGINVSDVRPDCILDRTLVKRFHDSWCTLPRPRVVVQRRASRWTPNKDWPEEYWVELIECLSQRTGVVEIGDEKSGQKISSENYVDLRGDTSLEELVAVTAAGDIFVGPDSGPAHIAAAVGTPAVVILGGYTHPRNISYIENVNLYTAVGCAPCWLREPCPYDLKCLKMIRPSSVESEVWKAWANHKMGVRSLAAMPPPSEEVALPNVAASKTDKSSCRSE
jgi:ADP-heptose:LPS heptosyltransferase